MSSVDLLGLSPVLFTGGHGDCSEKLRGTGSLT